MSARRSWTDEQLISIVSDCSSYSELMQRLGLKESGSGRMRMQHHVKRLNLDVSHFRAGRWAGMTRENHPKWVTDENLFKYDVQYTTSTKRRYLEKVEYKCTECGISEWNGKPLVLQVDHIDGNNRNNVLTNLRLLCPNCHSQTETYARPKSYLEKNVQDVNLSTV